MSEHPQDDRAPGEEHRTPRQAILSYLIGLGAAILLTVASFGVAAGWGGVWTPGIPMALTALAVGQMGVHLVFFLHLTSGPDNTNNSLALAFGTLIVGLVLVGTLWIMAHVNHQHMAADMLQRMQR